MIGWWRRRRAAREEIEAEARALLARFGDEARREATNEMIATAHAGDREANERWTRIGTLIDRESARRGCARADGAGASAPPGMFAA